MNPQKMRELLKLMSETLGDDSPQRWDEVGDEYLGRAVEECLKVLCDHLKTLDKLVKRL